MTIMAHGEIALAKARMGQGQGSALIAASSCGRGGGTQNARNAGGPRRRQQQHGVFCHYHNIDNHDEANCHTRHGIHSQAIRGGKRGWRTPSYWEDFVGRGVMSNGRPQKHPQVAQWQGRSRRRGLGHGFTPRYGDDGTAPHPGSQLPYCDPPAEGYDYSDYPVGLCRPFGDEPPIHPADDRKCCTACEELGHMHTYCLWLRGGRPHTHHPLHHAVQRDHGDRHPSAQRTSMSQSYGATNDVQSYDEFGTFYDEND